VTRPSARVPAAGELARLRQAVAALHPVADDDWALLAPLVTAATFARGSALLRPGDPARNVFFVLDGLLREFFVDDQGRTSTRRFGRAGDFSGSLADLLSGRPALSAIEAVEDTEVLQVPWARFEDLAQQRPAFERAVRRMTEALYLQKTIREHEMIAQRADERYRRFREANPDLEARVPQHHVASYLGITPVHLSRLRAAARSAPAAAAPPGRTRSARKQRT
jgi:CRP-like cAMP-binding protein